MHRLSKRPFRMARGPWLPWVPLLVATVLISCGDGPTTGAGPTGPESPAPRTTVTISPSSASVEVGSSVSFVATVRNASSSTVSWRTTNPAIASVDFNGVVTGVTAGTTSLVATAIDGTEATAGVLVLPPAGPVSVVVTNRLLNPIEVFANGISLGFVPAGQTRQGQAARASSIQVSWQLVRSVLSNGRPVGDIISASFNPSSNPGAQLTYEVDADLGGSFIFVPIFNNETASDLLITVNEGLQSQNRCDCLVPAFRNGVNVGYYKFFGNSNVRGYRPGSGYQGSYIYWDNLPNLIDRVSGRVLLRATTPP